MDKAAAQTAALDGEVELLLFDLRRSHAILDRAMATRDKATTVRYLQQVTEIYGSVKDLLPKVGLAPAQVAIIQDQLAILRSRLTPGPG